ncbi:NUDIX hydrolase [Anaerobacillus isosaccharinicus]|uniref:DNA mismatch repair protein MutT n=1 Tax=Anaerobacillus isosaccharinicus TaxID=1532552 RepID=A0A1S2MEI3_9BACI|nr:NUDIX hydrolase [Anaerobacillus isosaccharinicus]MBA5586504.1 NUDIX hydrolase [Anaerobacillus isosaccharinicus]QOY35255.1 NUDIX hydrolase [Anaerobacillus isosaccharinicus]
MKKGQIRAIAICIFRKNDLILVSEGFDELKQEYYYRPIGGGIEYGETSSNALKREVLEEIGANITNEKFLGAFENIFTYNGDLGHEIVFVYDADFVDKSFYDKPSFLGWEDNGVPFKLYWKPISDFKNEKIVLVPEELLTLL